jgi:DNA repair protein RecO (recombination protein O)
VEAVVLRRWDYGEADRMLVLYTLQMGKLTAIAKGIRKPRSRKAGHLEPFTRTSLQLARGRDLMIVTQAETIDVHLPLRDDMLLTTYAAYVVELMDRFTYEEGENRALYRTLINTLVRLSAGEMPDLVVRYYEMRLLDLLGFRPKLFACAGCETEIQPEDQYFSDERGGVLCPRCGRSFPGARPVSMDALRFLRHFQRSSYQDARRAHLSSSVNRELESLMQHYLTYLLERGLNSPEFLRRLREDG